MNRYTIGTLILFIVFISLKMRSCEQDNATTSTTQPSPVVRTPTITTPSSTTTPSATTPRISFPTYKGWKGSVLGEKNVEDNLRDGDTVTIRYEYSPKDHPEKVEMLPCSEEVTLSFKGGPIVYEGVDAKNVLHRLKYSDKKVYKGETEISFKEFADIKASFVKVRVLPGDINKPLVGYVDVPMKIKRDLLGSIIRMIF